ncbi:MAG: subfamily polymerase sigma-24 subunit [Frankiales bacterium]|nr:subfamily polymerase sigma-24 subunit [Frankiales bacterium]
MDDFTRFYETSYRSVYRVVVPMTLDRGDAEDVVQEAYAAAARQWDTVSAMELPVAWVRRVAVNRAVDLHRRRWSRRRAYGLLQPGAEHRDDLSVEVMDALSRLPVAERQVVVLHHLLDMPVEELAREVGRPSGTVKAQLVRGRRRLAAALVLEEGVGR